VVLDASKSDVGACLTDGGDRSHGMHDSLQKFSGEMRYRLLPVCRHLQKMLCAAPCHLVDSSGHGWPAAVSVSPRLESAVS
jgi:hypothetical protein